MTSEDKAVHILRISSDSLEHVNKRILPKRPCAICWSPESRHILVADKFGDVYDLPLESRAPIERDAVVENDDQEPPAKKFKPSANLLTVHSERNRKALENQIRMADQIKERKDLDDSLQPIIGHVSMTTDLVAFHCSDLDDTGEVFELGGSSIRQVKPSGPKRSVIVTSDRDEHIRMSRGIPQAHIIHGYCWGHQEYVSKLATLCNGQYLISGGGEPWLGVWKWSTGELLGKINLLDQMRKPATDSDQGKFAVSGIWTPEFTPDPSKPVNSKIEFLVGCEGVAKLQRVANIAAQPSRQDVNHVYQLSGNVLDVAYFGDGDNDSADGVSLLAIASLDTYHQSGSTTELRQKGNCPRLVAIPVGSPFLEEEAEPSKTSATVSNDSQRAYAALQQLDGRLNRELESKGLDVKVRADAKLGDLLYGVENLRKRAGPGKGDTDE